MKTEAALPLARLGRILRSRRIRCLPLFFVTVAAGLSAAAPETPPPVTPAPVGKSYHLFVGVDLSLIKDKENYPILDAMGSRRFAVRAGTAVKEMNLRDAASIQAQPSLKLSRLGATIGELQIDRDYSPGNSPGERAAHTIITMGDVQLQAQDKANMQGAFFNTPGFSPTTGPGAGTANSAAVAHSNAAPGSISGPSGSSQMSANYFDANKALSLNPIEVSATGSEEAGLAQGQFDAIRLNFLLTAERSIQTPYIAVVAEIHDPAKPEDKINWIYVRSLDAIGPTVPTKVHIFEAGFPPGFTYTNASVHVFAGGSELATNLSERNTALTRDQAFDYILLQYLGTHRGANLPAAPYWSDLPKDFRAHVTKDTLHLSFYVKTDAEGRTLSVSGNPEGTEKIDPYLESVIQNFRFTPALANGKPVAGTCKVVLADFVR